MKLDIDTQKQLHAITLHKLQKFKKGNTEKRIN